MEIIGRHCSGTTSFSGFFQVDALPSEAQIVVHLVDVAISAIPKI